MSETSPRRLGEVSGKSRTSRGSLGEVRVMEFGLNGGNKAFHVAGEEEDAGDDAGNCPAPHHSSIQLRTSATLLVLVLDNF